MIFLSPALAAYCIFLFTLLGLTAGSFCNAWAWRVAHHESIARGRSHGAECGHTLAARDLLPVVSYGVLRGRCRYCGKRISPRYPAVELLSAVFFVSILLRYDLLQPLTTVRLLLLGCILLVLSLVDLETKELPDRLLLYGALLFLLVPFESGWQGVIQGILGAVSVSVPLFLLVLLFDKLFKRETMGGGDLKLLFVLGLHFGPALMLVLLICACIIGILMGLGFQRGREKGEPSKAFPFGPAIALAAWLVMLAGQPFLQWYLSLFGGI